MLQRIQTVYLILAALLTAALYQWFPVIPDPAGVQIMDRNEPLILGLMIGAVLLILISIFSYKNRQRQFVINRLTILLNLALLGVFVFRSLTLSGESLLSEKGIGVLFPIISIVLLVMANRAIKRDEDLVKSVDRLR